MMNQKTAFPEREGRSELWGFSDPVDTSGRRPVFGLGKPPQTGHRQAGTYFKQSTQRLMIVPARTEEVRRPGWICSSLTYNLFLLFQGLFGISGSEHDESVPSVQSPERGEDYHFWPQANVLGES